jgi:hypothetical protein
MSSPDAEAGYRALAPPGFRFEVAARIALSIAAYRPVRYPIGHFEPYFGAPFERSVGDQLAFLRRHLQP